jgi:exopolysaccharide production protein ExoQ
MSGAATLTARLPATIHAAPRALRGLDRDRTATVFVAVAYLVLSKPDVLAFQHLLPAAVVLALAALHLVAGTARGITAVRLPTAVLILAGWLALTNLWTEDHVGSTLQTASTLLVVLVAVIVGSACSVRAVIGGVMWGGVLVLLLCLAVAAVSPSTGLMPAGYQGGALRGIYIHRNITAEVLAPAFAAALVHPFAGRHPRGRRLATLLVLLGGIVLTRSSTALSSVAVMIALTVVLAVVRRVPARHRFAALITAIAGTVGLGSVLVLNASSVFAILGRDSTLTGRTAIWAAAQQLIAARPIGGYGWGGAWDDGDFVRLYISRLATWDVPSAHNGYLDALVQAGAVGLVAFLLVAGLVVVRAVRRLLQEGMSSLAVFAPLLVAGLLVYNVGEANLVSLLSVFLLVTTLTLLTTVLRRSRALVPEPPGARAA